MKRFTSPERTKVEVGQIRRFDENTYTVIEIDDLSGLATVIWDTGLMTEYEIEIVEPDPVLSSLERELL